MLRLWAVEGVRAIVDSGVMTILVSALARTRSRGPGSTRRKTNGYT
jgi:hypothetical protein